MSHRNRLSRHCLAITLAAGTALTPAANATILLWNNSLGGAASTAANWNPVQAPTSADDLQFSLNAAYTVTYNASSAASRTQTYRIGTVTLNCSAPHTVSTGITVGSASPDIAVASLTSGVLNSTSSVVVGSGSLAQGTLTVSGSASDLNITGATADLTVGSNGIGTLNVTSGGGVSVADQFIAGNNSSSVANVTITGALSVSPFTRSSLGVSGATQSRLGQGGDATVSIANGAIASFNGPVVVANGSASTSTVTIGGTGGLAGLNRATLTAADDLDIAKNQTAGSSAGSGTVIVNNGGTLTVSGTTSVGGDPDGGTGTLRLTGNAVCTTHSMVLDVTNGGTLDFQGGTITIDGGSLTQNPSNQIVNLAGAGAGDNPTLRFINGATFTVANSFGLGTTASRAATAEILSGGFLSVISGGLNIGSATGSTGTMLVSGPGSRLNSGNVSRVGQSGNGSLTIDNSALAESDVMEVATNAGTSGTVIVRNSGSLTSFNGISVGGTSAAQGGTGTLTIESNGIFATGSFLTVWGGSSVSVDHGQLNAALATVSGTLDLHDQALVTIINPTNRFLLNGGTLRGLPTAPGSATIDGRFEATNGAVIQAINGNLTLGDPNNVNGFRAIGPGGDPLINCGSHTINIRTAVTANVADVTLAGGALTCPADVVTNSSSTISGFGTITASELFVTGALAPTSTGIRFNGAVHFAGTGAPPATASGTALGFNAGSTLDGAGTIACDVDADAGSTIAPTGNMTLGRSISAFGCTIDGTLLCQNHTVTLLDSNGVGLGTLTDLGTANGVRLICAQNITVNSGRTLQGEGSIQTPLLTINGTIRPGDAVFFNNAFGTGIIGNTGAVTLGANADAFFDLGDPTEGSNQDRISATGVATVNGHLHARLEVGFTPFVGEFFDIVVGSSRVGTFSTEDLPPGFSTLYMADRVRLIFNGLPCEGDLNCDGNVDQDDVAALIATIAGNPTDFCRDDPDINHDGNADQDDVTAFINLIAGGPCP